MKKILMSLIMIGLVSATTVGATTAVFSDTETSNGNTFTAGSLDLKINGGDVNVSHTESNLGPHSQPNFTYRLRNAGSLAGYLNMKNISVTSNENGCNDPETGAGDTTCGDPGEGELANVLNYRLMIDNNCNGWQEVGDQIFFQGYANTMADHFTFNKALAPGAEVCINSLINWWTTADDNKAQTDDMTVNFGFELNQDLVL